MNIYKEMRIRGLSHVFLIGYWNLLRSLLRRRGYMTPKRAVREDPVRGRVQSDKVVDRTKLKRRHDGDDGSNDILLYYTATRSESIYVERLELQLRISLKPLILMFRIRNPES